MSAGEPLREEYVPVEFVDTTNLPEKEWLAWRRKGIGGSDAAAIMGISPFRTARDIYYDKLNIAPQENSEENWVALKMGHLLEDLVAEIFSHKTGLEVFQIKRMFQHPLHKFMLADVDYFVSLPDGGTAILEIKTTNYNARSNWWEDAKEIVPPYPHIEDILQRIKPKYEFADETYTVLVPERIEEIMIEGRLLGHCVANIDRYWDRIERRESYVLFLRHTADVDRPYYTLEVEPNGTIRQKRTQGDNQEADIEEASAFLRKWQKTVAKRLDQEDLELAKASKMLRIQEFEELRESQVTVRTGKLAGVPLLEVLQQDLMEAA